VDALLNWLVALLAMNLTICHNALLIFNPNIRITQNQKDVWI
jgi:hypothetical protein